jgi:hypothetical protein
VIGRIAAKAAEAGEAARGCGSLKAWKIVSMAAPTHSHRDNPRELADKLNAMTADGARLLEPEPVLSGADAIVTHVEVCGCHGVGRLVQMLFDGEPNILSIRSANLYGGRQEFGGLGLCVAHEDKSRDAVFCRVLEAVGQTTVKRVLCIPYFADDVRTALALREIFGVPLRTYIMDDQNVCADGIPDDLMRELAGVRQLELVVRAAGNGITSDEAYWIHPVLR